MGFLSSLGSDLAGALGSSVGKLFGGMIAGGASSALSYHFDLKQAKELAKYNMQLQKELNEYNAVNRYPWAVKSMRDANLNPVLAATQGQPLSGGSVQAQAINAKRGQDVINTAMALGQLDNMREQNKNLQAQNDFIKAQTLTQVQSAREIKARVEALERDLKFYRDHPDVYRVQQYGKMSGIVGQIMAGGEMLDAMTPPFSYGSKSIKRALKNFRFEESY